MKQSELKKLYDPELGRFTRQHIYGEGVMDVLKNIGSKVFGQTLAKAAKTAANKAITTAATKTGEHVGKKAGDKIISMLSKSKINKSNTPKNVTFNEPLAQAKKNGKEIAKILMNSKPVTVPMSQQDRYQQLGLILNDD